MFGVRYLVFVFFLVVGVRCWLFGVHWFVFVGLRLVFMCVVC